MNFKIMLIKNNILSILIVAALMLVSDVAAAKVMIVTDVDDTLKRAHVLSTKDMLVHGVDYKTRFFGMASLLNTLVVDRNAKITYLSNAPEILMKKTHRKFLVNGGFPNGTYIGRKIGDDKHDHKFQHISRLIDQEQPTTLILIGDNGEYDSRTFERIREKFKSDKLNIVTYLRVVYGNLKNREGVVPPETQLGFITPFEIILDLDARGLVSYSATETYLEREGLRFLNNKLEDNEVRYTYFQRCDYYKFPLKRFLNRYDLVETLNSDLERFCTR